MAHDSDQPGPQSHEREPRPKSVRHAVAWSYVMSWVQQVANVVVFLILAKLLEPEQFGQIAIAWVLIGFLQLFVEQGMTAALVQRKDLSPEHLDSAFWIVTVASLALAGAAFGLAGWWAVENDAPELRTVVQVLAISPIITGLTIVQQAVLQRAMDFQKLALRTSISVLTGAAVGVGMALAGLGVWALVGQTLANALAGVIVLWAASRWRPGRRFSWRHATQLLSFSGRSMLETLGFFAGSRSVTVVMGLHYGAVPVGVYSLATRMMDTATDALTRPLGNVALPRFSRLQDDRASLRDAVLQFIHMSAAVIVPPMVVLAIVSDSLMALLGEKWIPAADPLKVLCLVGIGGSITRFTGPLLQAVGRPELQAALIWVFGICNTLGFLAAARMITSETVDESVAMAAVYAGVNILIMAPLCLGLTMRFTGMTIMQLAKALAPAAIAGVASAVVGLGLRASGALATAPRIVEFLALSIAAGAAGAVTVLCIDPKMRELLSQVIAKLRQIVAARGA